MRLLVQSYSRFDPLFFDCNVHLASRLGRKIVPLDASLLLPCTYKLARDESRLVHEDLLVLASVFLASLPMHSGLRSYFGEFRHLETILQTLDASFSIAKNRYDSCLTVFLVLLVNFVYREVDCIFRHGLYRRC